MASKTGTETPPKTLREAIVRSQLTNDQIVAKVGCTKKSLTNWKNGVRPRDYYIGRLSTVLGFDLWLLYGKPEAANNSKESIFKSFTSAMSDYASRLRPEGSVKPKRLVG